MYYFLIRSRCPSPTCCRRGVGVPLPEEGPQMVTPSRMGSLKMWREAELHEHNVALVVSYPQVVPPVPSVEVEDCLYLGRSRRCQRRLRLTMTIRWDRALVRLPTVGPTHRRGMTRFLHHRESLARLHLSQRQGQHPRQLLNLSPRRPQRLPQNLPGHATLTN